MLVFVTNRFGGVRRRTMAHKLSAADLHAEIGKAWDRRH